MNNIQTVFGLGFALAYHPLNQDLHDNKIYMSIM